MRDAPLVACAWLPAAGARRSRRARAHAPRCRSARRRGAAGFAQALAPRPFVFPRDHGPHPQFRQEWWYLTGNLEAADGERFGFELTFFRFALAPPGRPGRDRDAAAAAARSAWRTRQIYMAHFAITDVAAPALSLRAEAVARRAGARRRASAEPLRGMDR